MLEIADQKSVKGLGYIGGVMGPKEFTDSKSYVVQMLCSSKHKFYVEPTLVYGNGRNDIVFSLYKLSVLCELFIAAVFCCKRCCYPPYYAEIRFLTLCGKIEKGGNSMKTEQNMI